ncbi:MAG: hypothetical protein ACUVTX_12405, partial [Bacteroidales bacterium]
TMINDKLKRQKNKQFELLLCGIIFFIAFTIFMAAPVTQVADSNYSMMLSQSLLDHGSFRLDGYKIPRFKPYEKPGVIQTGYPYQIEEINGHLHYFFPPGSSVLSVPFVAIMNLFGISAVNPDGSYNFEGEVKIEKNLSALLMAVLTMFFFITARQILPLTWSLIVAIGSALGTQILSTASRALWSDTWGIFLLSIVLFMLFRNELGKKSFHPVALATILSWTYFVKPTYSISILVITVFIFLFYRQTFVYYVLTGMIWFGIFVGYSWHYFGKWPPTYYSASRLSFSKTCLIALAGHLVSPARGLLIYSPFILFILYLLWRYYRYVVHKRLLWTAIIAFFLHLITVSSFPHWWAGHSFGPRFMVGVLPWEFLLSIIGIHAMISSWQQQAFKSNYGLSILPAAERIKMIIGALLLITSIFINWRGAYAHSTSLWNVLPVNVDQHPERIWDWRQPQFLAGIIEPPLPERFPLYHPGERVYLNSEQASKYLLSGWSGPEPRFRWTDGKKAIIGFRLEHKQPLEFRIKLAPFVVPGKHELQVVKVLLNGRELAILYLVESSQNEYLFILPVKFLKNDNIIEFNFKNSASPASYGVNSD